MNLIDENVEKESEEKQKRIVKLIIFAIIALIAIVIVIIAYSAIKKKNILTITVDGEKKDFKAEMYIMENKKNLYVSESGQIYISVRDFASMLGVESYNDEFKGKGEDTTKCFIKTDNEYTSYVSGSSQIYKVIDNKPKKEDDEGNNSNKNKDEIIENDYEYEYFNIEDGVRYVDNKIFASQEAIELGFNVSVVYDQKNKAITVYTLKTLQDTAVSTINNKNGGVNVATDGIPYNNKKLLKYGLAVVKNGSNDYGVTNYFNYQEGNNILSCRYTDIKFIESIGCLVVTDSKSGKQGVQKIDLNGDKNSKTLIATEYDEIKQLSEDGKLYAIKQNGKYGIIEILEEGQEIKTKIILNPEYQAIGLDNYKDYEEMESRYLVGSKYIPIKQNNKWGLVDLDGKIEIVPQYDIVGCPSKESGKPVVCIPKLKNGNDAVVFGTIDVSEENENETTIKYSLVNVEKKSKIGYDAVEIYALDENNEKVYYMKVQAADSSVHRLNIYDMYFEEATKKDKK